MASALGKFSKRHYFISPDEVPQGLPENVQHIKCSGNRFLQAIKEQMCSSGCYLKDEVYDIIENELIELTDEHCEFSERFPPIKFPHIIIVTSYQDGLLHGYRRILDGRPMGRHSDIHQVQSQLWCYDELIKRKRREKKYHDVAYFQGYANSLQALVYSHLADCENWLPPRYFYLKLGEMDADEFQGKVDVLPSIHKAAFQKCLKFVRDSGIGPNHIIEHRAW